MFVPHLSGIVFENLDSANVEYTIRMRHEVFPDNTWYTSQTGPFIQVPGARVTPKLVQFVAKVN